MTDTHVTELLKAEKEVSSMINSAVARKNDKMRTINTEASNYINSYQAKKENEFQKQCDKVSKIKALTLHFYS